MKKATGLIPQDFIESLLIATDLVEIIGKFVTLKKSGKNYQACCPFHDEKSPSFTVSPEKQFYYCFGCGAHGNAINFVMKHLNLPFTEAVQQLTDHAGLKLPETAKSSAEQSKRVKTKPLNEAMSFTASFFRKQLAVKPGPREVLHYLKKRNLTDSTIEAFKLGYAPPGWNGLIKALPTANIKLDSADEAGLIIQKPPNKCYDRFRNRLMFPIRNRKGDVIAFGGRALNNEDKPKYLNSPETPLFHKNRELYGLYEITQEHTELNRILVVEGYLDVLMLWQNQIRYAVATLGTSTSSNHLETLFKLVDEVVFCFDGDQAGAKAANRALETALPLMRDGREVRFLLLPPNEDPDSLVQKEGKGEFELRISQSKALPDFLCNSLSEQLDLNQIEHRARFVRDISPLLRKLPSGVYKELVINQVATLTQLDRELVIKHIEESAQPPHNSVFSHEPPPASPSYPPSMDAPLPVESASHIDSSYQYNNNKSRRSRQHQQQAALPAAAPSPSIVDDTIRLLLYKPSLATEISAPHELSQLKEKNIDLLLEVIEATKKEPLGSSAYLFGRLHGSPKGEQLAKIAAQELISYPQEDDYKKVYKDSLDKLKLTYIEQQLEEALSVPQPDPELVKRLVLEKGQYKR